MEEIKRETMKEERLFVKRGAIRRRRLRKEREED